jgi:hypothetical protein
MTLVQQSSSNHWFEDAPDSDTLTIPAFFQKDGSGDWILATTGAADGVAANYDGSGDFKLVDVSAGTTSGTSVTGTLVGAGTGVTVNDSATYLRLLSVSGSYLGYQD